MKKCCEENLVNLFKFCSECGQPLVYTPDPSYGLWSVSTERDCEGRCLQELGLYIGYLDEIAFELSNRSYYMLYFKKVCLPSYIFINDISFDKKDQPPIVSNTIEVEYERNFEIIELKELLKDRPVKVKKANYYESSKIILDKQK